MTIRKELLEIPHALQQMYDEGCPHYDSAIRGISWSEKPIFMIGSNSSYLAALSGAWAFESLLGLPVIVRRPSDFSAYTRRALANRSLVVVVSGSGDCEETLQAAKKAKTQGAIVWAITADPKSELAGLADAVVNCYSGESPADGSLSIFCRHAVMLFLAVAAARVLKAPAQLPKDQEEELGKLAMHVEWVLNQIGDAGRALAQKLAQLPRFSLVGGGPFYPIAMQEAQRLRLLAGVCCSGYELMDFRLHLRQISEPGTGVLYLSSSRFRLKENIYQSVRESRQKGGQIIFAVTDRNDRQLSERSDMAILLPSLTEAGGALLALAVLEIGISHAARASTQSPAKARHPRRP